MKVLLSGNKGFIGAQIWNELVKSEHSFAGFDQGEAIPDGRFDIIVHFGARTLIRKSREMPYQYFLDNEDLTLRLLEKARKDHTTVVFPTSGSVMEATNPYSLSKKNGEDWLNLYDKMFGVKSYILRLFNIYGETSRKGAVFLFSRAALDGSPAVIYGDGTHVRDYTHVSDVVRFVFSILSKSVPPGSYEVGTGVGTSVKDLIKIVEAETGKKITIRNEDYVVPEAKNLHAKVPIMPNMIKIDEGVKRVVNTLRSM